MISNGTLFAIVSTFLWALSVPILREALGRAPPQDAHTVSILGLLISLTVGCLVLSTTLVLQGSFWVLLTPGVVLAGLLMFPIGTGAYYLGTSLLNGHSEVVAQLAKTKPLIVSLFAVLFLSESIKGFVLVAYACILSGVSVIVIATLRHARTILPILVGFAVPLAWAAADALAAREVSNSHPANVVLGMLICGWFGVALLMLCLRKARVLPCLFLLSRRQLGFFSLHGVTSFGFAYSCYFAAVERIGLAASA